MSYKEVRDLFEKLKILGYPKPLKLSALYTTQGSLENFKLVFDIMGWLIDQYEPGTQLEGGTTTDVDRTLLVRSAVEFLAIKAGLKLNPIRLYSSSMAAAPELLKVVDLILQRSQAEINASDADDEKHYGKLGDIDIDDRIKARQRGRELSIKLTETGASLYDLLGKEKGNQDKRSSQVVRQMESSNVEQILRNALASSTAKMNVDKDQLDNLLKEKQAVSAKVERKKADLERLRQRLDTLQKIRPAYSEDFEKAEEELQDLFSEYFIHVRCLDSLRSQMNANVKATQPISDIGSKSSAPTSMLLPDGVLDFSDDLSQEDADLLNDDSKEMKSKRRVDSTREPDELKSDGIGEIDSAKAKLRIKTGVKRNDSRQIGNMLGEGEAESDLESSLDFNGQDDDSDDDSELNVDNLLDDPAANVEALYNFSENKPARVKSAKPKVYQSDEDF